MDGLDFRSGRRRRDKSNIGAFLLSLSFSEWYGGGKCARVCFHVNGGRGRVIRGGGIEEGGIGRDVYEVEGGGKQGDGIPSVRRPNVDCGRHANMTTSFR